MRLVQSFADLNAELQHLRQRQRAFAQAVGGSPQDSLPTFLLPMALIFVVFYFFMLRPQQTKQKQLKSMLESLRRGDRVVTAGGLIGTIAKADNALATLTDALCCAMMPAAIAAMAVSSD